MRDTYLQKQKRSIWLGTGFTDFMCVAVFSSCNYTARFRCFKIVFSKTKFDFNFYREFIVNTATHPEPC